VALIAGLVVHLVQGAFVVVVNWDTEMGKGILEKRNVRLRYAASEIDNLKPVPIVPNIPSVISFTAFRIRAASNTSSKFVAIGSYVKHENIIRTIVLASK